MATKQITINGVTKDIHDKRLPDNLGTAGQVLTVNDDRTGIEWSDITATDVTVGGQHVDTYEMNNKLDKVTSTSGRARLYAIQTDGTQYVQQLGETPFNYGIAQWSANGQLKTFDPTDQYHCANKRYVDSAIEAAMKPTLTQLADGSYSMEF